MSSGDFVIVFQCLVVKNSEAEVEGHGLRTEPENNLVEVFSRTGFECAEGRGVPSELITIVEGLTCVKLRLVCWKNILCHREIP